MTRMERRMEMEAKKKKARVKWMLLLAFLASTLLFYFFGPELIRSFIAPQETAATYPIVFNGKPQQAGLIVSRSMPFVDVEWVKDHLLPEMGVLPQSGKARWFPKPGQIRFARNQTTEKVSSTSFPLEVSLLEHNDQFFFPVREVAPLLGIITDWQEASEILLIDELHIPIYQGGILGQASLRVGMERFSGKLGDLPAGETVRVLEIYEKHYRVVSADGKLGFLSQSDVGELRQVMPDPWSSLLPPASPKALPNPFGMVWDYVGGSHPDRSEEEKIDGLSVFSPTWFELRNAEGYLENRGQFQYARDMKQKGYQLWGLVTNSFDPDLTEAFLENEDARRRLISQLLVYSALYELDGINIDFENIHYRNQDQFTGFVQELAEALRNQDLIVSIDVTIPGGSLNWSQVYDRSALEPHVDYFAVMTYDEHWGSSPVAGSVASFGWVERGIVATLNEVPPEKVILGIPLYTRLWEESPGIDGRTSVSSRAMGMQFIRRTLEDNGVSQDDWEWQESAGQYYAEYQAEGKRYRVWLEDERSLELKVSLIDTYNLAGYAAWRKDFELPEIWVVLSGRLRDQQANR